MITERCTKIDCETGHCDETELIITKEKENNGEIKNKIKQIIIDNIFSDETKLHENVMIDEIEKSCKDSAK